MSLSPASSSASPVAVPAKRPASFLLAIGLAAVLTVWSVNYIAGKITLAHIAAFTLIPFRAELVGALLLAIYFAQPKARRTPLRKHDIWTFAYLGFFGYAVNQGCFVLGLSHTTSQHSVVIVSLGPIIILLLASAMKLEKLTPSKLLGMAISFAGVVSLETEHGSPMNSPLLAGDLIVLCGTLGFSLYTVLGKRLARSYDSISMNAFNASASAVIFLPLAIHQAIKLEWKSVGWQGWAGLLYMTGFSAVLGYLLFYWLLRHMDASRVVAVNYFQPVCVFLLSIPILGERLTPRLLASAALVLLGVYLAEHISRREPPLPL